MLGLLILGILFISVLWQYKKLVIIGFSILFLVAGIVIVTMMNGLDEPILECKSNSDCIPVNVSCRGEMRCVLKSEVANIIDDLNGCSSIVQDCDVVNCIAECTCNDYGGCESRA